MVPVVGAVIGFAVGAVLAGLLNLELVGYARQAAQKSSDGAQVLRWIMRAFLVLAPLAFAWIGFMQAEAIIGGAV